MRRSLFKHRFCSLVFAAGVLFPTTFVAQTVSDPDERELRQLFSELKASPVSAERIAAIRAVGFQLVAASRYDAAAQLFEAVLAASPRDQQATYGAALSLFNLKHLVQARELAKLAADYAGPDNKRKADALVLVGVILAVEGNNGEALGIVRQAVQLAPENFDANFALGRALYGAGDLNNAVRAFRKALSLKPRHAQALFFLATTLEAAGDSDSARDTYLELIRIEPKSAEGHLGLGVLLAKLNAPSNPDAINALSMAVVLKSDLYEARVALGKALIKAGRFREAVPHLQTAARLAPGNPEPHYQLGLAYRRLGNTEAAAGAAAKVNEINSSRRGTKPKPPVPDDRN